jgi:hypothetical protein
MITDNFCFYLPNRLIQTGQTGGQWYSDTSPLVFPAETIRLARKGKEVGNTLAYYDTATVMAIEYLWYGPPWPRVCV